MVYIKRHNLCFIGIPKNASTSIITFLYRNWVDQEDIISYATDDNNNVVAKWVNCNDVPNIHVSAQFVINTGLVPTSANFLGVIRNPYERLLSYCFYLCRENNIVCTPHYFQNWLKLNIKKYPIAKKQTDYLTYNNKLIGNFWLYDNIEKHVKELCKNYNIEIKHPLTIINKTDYNKKNLINTYYGILLKREIKAIFKEDFDLYHSLEQLYLN